MALFNQNALCLRREKKTVFFEYTCIKWINDKNQEKQQQRHYPSKIQKRRKNKMKPTQCKLRMKTENHEKSKWMRTKIHEWNRNFKLNERNIYYNTIKIIDIYRWKTQKFKLVVYVFFFGCCCYFRVFDYV